MQNVPKIVRERLKAVAPAVNHPDADVLTAFGERSLPESERGAVLEHLAGCGDCRDIVALALPATQSVQTTVRPASGGWLSWPTLRWGFVAAGVVAIVAFGLLQYQRRPAPMAAKQPSQSVEVAANETKKSVAPFAAGSEAGKKEKLQAPSAPAFTDSFDAANAVVNGKKSRARADAEPAPAVPEAGRFHGNASNSLRHGGPSLANQWQQQNVIQNQAQAPATPNPFAKQQAAGGGMSAGARVPTTNQTVEVSAAAPVMATESASPEARQGQDQAAAPSPSADAYANVARAKPPVAQALGQIGGYVVDPTGAVVSNARITITPSTTGATATAVTNSQGTWLIAGLPTGTYKARAEAPGFKTTVLDVNYDAASQPSMYRFILSPGSVAEMVEVSSGQNAQVQAETATVSGPITGLKVSQVPTRGRDFNQLAIGSPRWIINASGALERSFDQGKSWQTVDVYANAAVGANFSAAVATSRAKVKDAEKALKRDIATPTFRAVAATGSDVWAGGSGGALYHSADAGNHWTRIVPATAGAVLTGDIISLEFSDLQHGKVSTSTPEVWATTDGGQSWQKH